MALAGKIKIHINPVGVLCAFILVPYLPIGTIEQFIFGALILASSLHIWMEYE